MNLSFEKYSAHGNDFIIIDNRDHKINEDDYAVFRRLCERRTSVGADGVILLDNINAGIKINFYNADGYSAPMCGNGLRAAVDCAQRLDIFTNEGVFYVGNKRHSARILNNGEIGVEIFLESDHIITHSFTFGSKIVTGYYCDTGTPHIVFFDTELFEDSSLSDAKEIRYSEKFAPFGTNVNFVHIKDSGTIRIATYERGVEDFTYSCGTGATAAAFTGSRKKDLKFPVEVVSKGGALTVKTSDTKQSFWIWGKVVRVYAGIIENTPFSSGL